MQLWILCEHTGCKSEKIWVTARKMQQVCKAPGFGRGVFLDLRLKNNSRTSGQTVRATEGGNVRARGYRKLMELQVPKCDSFQANKFAVCICSWVSLKMRKSSLHMQDATQCIKKRHRAVFSDNLRQLEKKKSMLMKHH